VGDRRLIRLTMLLAALAIGAFALGCGGGDDDGDSGDGNSSAASAESGSDSGPGSQTDSESESDDSSSDSSSESDTSVSASSLSKPAFVKQANKICAVGAQKALGFTPKDTQASEAEYTAEWIEVAIGPSFQDVVDQIVELGAPAGDEEQVEAFVGSLQEAVDELEGDPDSYSSIQDVEKTLVQASDEARAYTLTRCAFARETSAGTQ
jgi:hypothetical protein